MPSMLRKKFRGSILIITQITVVLLLASIFQAIRPKGASGASLESTILYVDASASNPSDGLSWTTAYTDLQLALTTAISGTEIRVAEGIYKPTSDSTDRNVTFNMVDGVAIKGGYPSGGSLPEIRDPSTYITILSGDIDNNDTGFTWEDIVGSNTRRVVTANSGAGTSAWLDGFQISGGSTDSGGGIRIGGSNARFSDLVVKGNLASGNGGGIAVWNGNPIFTNVRVTSNAARFGGGVYAINSAAIISNSVFENNYAIDGGGAMYNQNSPIIIDATVFRGNSSISSGGIFNIDSDIVVTHSLFDANSAAGNINTNKDGGAVENVRSDPTFINTRFSNNVSHSAGAGMYNREASKPVIINCEFYGNVAGTETSDAGGSGITNRDNSDAVLINVVFSKNHASSGALQNVGSSPTLFNVVFVGNTGLSTGAIGNFYSNPTLINVTISGNQSDQGVQIRNSSSSSTFVKNSIIWGNVDKNGAISQVQIYNQTGTTVFQDSLAEGSNGSGASWNPTYGADAGGNLDANPHFVRPSSAGVDFVWGTADDDIGNLRLTNTSPAIDMGNNGHLPNDAYDLDNDSNLSEILALDFALNPRLIGFIVPTATVDIGAYETQPYLSVDVRAEAQTVVPGEDIRLFATFNNAGPLTATNVLLTNTTSISLAIASVDSNLPYTVTDNGLEKVFHFDTLPVGETGVLTLTARISDTVSPNTALEERVAISSAEPDLNLQDNIATTQIYIANVLYVDVSAQGAANGSSWQDAFTELQAALAEAYLGTQIRIAEGIYAPTSSTTTRMASFVLVDGTTLLGGFPTGGGTLLERDPEINETTLSGDIDQNDVPSPPQFPNQVNGQNSFHVVTVDGAKYPTSLDGVTISGGQADGSGHVNGGGIYSINGSNLHLRRVKVVGNQAVSGGGIHTSGNGSHSIVDSQIIGNKALLEGGGLFLSGGGSINVFHSKVHGNKAASGGAVYDAGVNLTISHVSFVGNSSVSNGGALFKSANSVEITNSSFVSNEARGRGDGMYNVGIMTPEVHNSVFWGNASVNSSNAANQIAYDAGGALSNISFSLIDGALVNGTWSSIVGIDGGGNVEGVPDFESLPTKGSDDLWGTVDDDYGVLSLRADSDLIDAGNNNLVIADRYDIDSNNETSERIPLDLSLSPRFIDVTTTTDTGIGVAPIVDIGAFEAQLGLRVQAKDADGLPVAGSIVLLQSAGQSARALPLGGWENPLTTNAEGVLKAPGAFAVGDRLLVARPVTQTAEYTVYETSAAPDALGLAMQVITDTEVVQHAVVSAENPLILFKITLSLEWNAQENDIYLDSLATNINAASRILYDLSDGQMALGNVRVLQNREEWHSADVLVFASNMMRPSALPGGIVNGITADTVFTGTNPMTPTMLITDAYLPGQVRMPPTWSRFGEAAGDSGEDWSRAFAHELSHHLLFLLDNYLGQTNDGVLTLVDCLGSVMTDAYASSYSEYLNASGWANAACESTLANKTTGRSDWETIQKYYPFLYSDRNIQGPPDLPLAVTQIAFVEPPVAATLLPDLNLELRDEYGGPIATSSGQIQTFLYKTQATPESADDYILALGAPVNGQLLVRGAETSDRLCVFDSGYTPRRVGCIENVQSTSDHVVLYEQIDWQPTVSVLPPYSNTLQITVTQSATQLVVQIFPSTLFTDSLVPTAIITPMVEVESGKFTVQLKLDEPSYSGFVRIYEPGTGREELTTYFFGGGWGPNYVGWGPNYVGWGPNYVGWGPNYVGWGVNRVGWGIGRNGWNAPIMSANGQVTVFDTDNVLGLTPPYILRSLTIAPELPTWLTPIGQVYEFVTPITPTVSTQSILFNYLQRDVPNEPFEDRLQIYRSVDEGMSWLPLTTELDPTRNLASAKMEGDGLYVLIQTIKAHRQPLIADAWNGFNFPINETRAVTEAMASLDGHYTSVCEVIFSGVDLPCYHAGMEPRFAPVVNTLDALRPEPIYAVYALTNTVPLYFGVETGGVSRAAPPPSRASAIVLDLPATFYGELTNNGLVGDVITAAVDGVSCGEAVAVALGDGAIGYAIQVQPEQQGACGLEGAFVEFSVNGLPATASHQWDNAHAIRLDISKSTPTQVAVNSGGSSQANPLLIGSLILASLAAITAKVVIRKS